MVYAGLTLMLAGMTTVFIFLLLMIFTIQILAFFTAEHTANEHKLYKAQQKSKRTQDRKNLNQKEGGFPLAVIAAAISAFEQDSTTG